MADNVALRSQIRGYIQRAAASDNANSALMQLAAKHLPDLEPSVRATRTAVLRMAGALSEKEFEDLMDVLAKLWSDYRKEG